MIYLDSAATTLQKPAAVGRAMWEALTSMSAPGRGGHPPAMRAAETALQCRSEIGELFGVRDPERVVFTMNATHGLNLAIKSLVPPGGRVVISGYEHNAVTRPLKALGAKVAVAATPLFCREAVISAFEGQITERTDAVVCNHVSNVFGFVQPIEAIAALCRAKGVPLIVDASQSAGVLPLDLDALGAAFAAMPGHKGLYGPQGTGVLLCGKGPVQPLLEGGTGSLSLLQEMPEFLPDRLEAGTHNMPGIAGLLAGVRFVRERGVEAICRHERELIWILAEELQKKHGSKFEVFSTSGLREQVGVLSVSARGKDPEEIGEFLAGHGIAVRAGLHCAPLAHRTAGTLERGTVRLSTSSFNTAEEIRACLRVLGEI